MVVVIIQKKNIINSSSTKLDDNVVGVFLNTNKIIEEYNLPTTYKDFEKEVKKPKIRSKKIEKFNIKIKDIL